MSPDTIDTASSESSVLLTATDLSCIRGDRLLFSGLNLQVMTGQVLELRGDNGSGKTSLLRILASLAQPEEGSLLWKGFDLNQQRAEYLQDMIYIAHKEGVKLALSALENLRFYQAMLVQGNDVSLEDTLRFVGLEDFRDMPASSLSSGQRRRLALARLKISTAKLWLLDEPLTSLDESNKKMVKKLIIDHINSQGSVVLTSHDEIDWAQNPVETIRL